MEKREGVQVAQVKVGHGEAVAAGGICTFDQAEALLRQGHADLVASARQSLADPD